jgi:hypothetical protein
MKAGKYKKKENMNDARKAKGKRKGKEKKRNKGDIKIIE